MVNPSDNRQLMLYSGVAIPLRPLIEERHPDIEIVEGSRRALDAARLEDVEWLVGWKFPDGIFGNMPRLRWVQSVGVGVENWISDPTLAPDVRVTSTKGLYADVVAEYVVWALLSLSRRFHVGVRNQWRRKWVQVTGYGLAGKVVGIVGMGKIGKAVARRLAAFDMDCIGIERRAEHLEDYADLANIVEVSELKSVLGQLDVLVLCLPLTAESENMFDGDVLRGLKKGAIVINVAREGVMDYASLVREIERGHLAGAAIDVFEKEPLRWWSPLWKQRDLLVSPHIAGLTKDYKNRVADRICKNIDRMKSGNPLLGLVDRTEGY